MDERVRVIYGRFDCDFKGVTLCRYEDGEEFYTIVINENLCDDVQFSTFRHEIAHIANDDFNSAFTADEIERMRHTL